MNEELWRQIKESEVTIDDRAQDRRKMTLDCEVRKHSQGSFLLPLLYSLTIFVIFDKM